MLKRERRHSSNVAPNAIPLKRVANIRLVQIWTESSDAKLAKLLVTHTPRRTNRRVSQWVTFITIYIFRSGSPADRIIVNCITADSLISNPPLFHHYRYHLEWRHPLRVLGKPKEVHPRHQDGLRWYQEGEGTSRSYLLHQASLEVEQQQCVTNSNIKLASPVSRDKLNKIFNNKNKTKNKK